MALGGPGTPGGRQPRAAAGRWTHLRSGPIALAGLIACVALWACDPAPRVGDRTPSLPPGEARTFTALMAEVIVPRCATSGCHSGDPAPAWPPLDPGVAWGALVGVPSQQAPTASLVEPYDPSRSYLVAKLRGTAGDAGGTPTPMPIGDAALDEADIAAVEAWIALGALDD